MFAHRDAIVRLLRDDDPDTVRLVKEQLALHGEDYLSDLRDLARMDDECVSVHAREVLERIAETDADEDFLLLCHFFQDENDLERACWMLARALNPTLDTQPYEEQVNEWGRTLLMRISGVMSARERVEILGNLLAGELDFRGNTEDYYLDLNSLLPSVMEMRMGIPITLAILYRIVACRAGMKVEGINLPGHFIARHGDIFFDPFHRGRIMTKMDCEEILTRQNLRLRASHLEAASSRQILVRVLANLLYVYDLQKDTARHAQVNAWIQALGRES